MEARVIEGATDLKLEVQAGRLVKWSLPSTNVIIMAGGTRRDWAPHGYRQLLSVDGETLIDRLVRQTRDLFATEPIVIVNNYEKPFGYDLHYLVMDTSTPTEALELTEPFWGDTTIILQGDVYYPETALNIVDLKDFFCYGRGAELYAMKFHRPRWDLVKDAIKKAKAADKIGRLWMVYRAYDGIPFHLHKFGPSYYTFRDYDSPVDFDHMKHYNEFIEKRSRRN